MLHLNKSGSESGDASHPPEAVLFDTLKSIIRILNRQRPIVIVVLICCVSLGMLYYFTTPARYTAGGTLVIDKRKLQLFQKESVLGDIEVDTATVQTEVEVLKSDDIGLAVIRKLRLTGDPEFVSPSKGPVGRLLAFATSLTGLSAPKEAPSETDLENSTLRKFNSQRTVSRRGLTYAIDIGFTSHNPATSARIVNALADAYIDDQLNAKYQATRRASVWLQQRIEELRTEATAAERAVLDFKRKNNIVDAGGGRLISEQDLVEVNSQLILARAATAEAKARLDRINTVMKQDIADASVADALKSEVIIKLRGQYLEIAQREAIWARLYGANHLATVNLRTQMEELQRSIKDQMRKIAESYKSDYEIALARQNSLEASLASVVNQTQTTGQAQIKARELESNAETSRALYDTFLQRYMEAVQQQSVPVSEARLVSPAIPPPGKSAPKLTAVLLVTLASGAFLSFGIAYLREASDSTLRTASQVEETLHFSCLAVAPIFTGPPAQFEFKKGPARTHKANCAPASRDWLRYAVDSPFSRYAEAIRSVKIAADLSGTLKSYKVIGVTSTLPNEGKSTISANLAHLIADAGRKVILVDADLRSPSLSRKYAPDSPGSIGAVMGNVALDDVIVPIPLSSLHFLPAGTTARLPHTNEVLASVAFKECIDFLCTKYDYIIVDLSPVAPIVDVRATGHFIDTYVYVVEWGATKIEVIERGLAEAGNVTGHLLGVVLNKVNTSTQSRYELYHGNKYHQKYYMKYGYME